MHTPYVTTKNSEPGQWIMKKLGLAELNWGFSFIFQYVTFGITASTERPL